MTINAPYELHFVRGWAREKETGRLEEENARHADAVHASAHRRLHLRHRTLKMQQASNIGTRIGAYKQRRH